MGSALGLGLGLQFASTALGSSVLAPLSPPTGETGSAGTSFGVENSLIGFQGGGFPADTSGAFGGVAVRGMQLPSNAALQMPSTGDHWYFLMVRPSADSGSTSSWEHILGSTQGNFTNGGGLCIAPQTTSATTPAGTYGQISLYRPYNPTSFHLWPAGNSTAVVDETSGLPIRMAFNQTYGVAVGLSGANSRICVAQADPTISAVGNATVLPTFQSKQQATGGTRPTGGSAQQLFNLVGCNGNAGGRQGFCGSVADLVIVSGGTFPTDQQVKDLASGALKISDIPTATGGTVKYYNGLDYSQLSGGLVPATVVGSSLSTGATVIGTGQRATAPLRQGTKISLDTLPIGFTFPLELGATTGRVWFTGKHNAAGYPIQARIVDASGTAIVDWTTIVAAAAGTTYRGYIDGVSSSTRGYREVRIDTDANHVVKGRNLFQMGVVVAYAPGQSEIERQFEFALASGVWSDDLDTTSGGNGGSGHAVAPNSSAGPWMQISSHFNRTTTANNTSHSNRIMMPSTSTPMSRAVFGDGAVTTCNRFMTGAGGAGVHLINLLRSGHPVESFVFGDVQFSRTLAQAWSGSGTYAATAANGLMLDTATLQSAFPGTLAIVGSWINQVRPYGITLVYPSGVVLNTNNSIADTGQQYANLYVSTDTGFTTVVGTVDTRTGAIWGPTGGTGGISAAVIGATPGSVVGTWTSKQETVAGTVSYTARATPDGYSIKDEMIRVLNYAAPFGVSVLLMSPGSSNVSTMTASGVNTCADYFGAFADIYRDWFSSLYAGQGLSTNIASPKMIYLPMGRQTGNTAANMQIVRNAARLLLPGAAKARSYMVPMQVWNYDQRMDGIGSGHPSNMRDGGMRTGLHIGQLLLAAFKNDKGLCGGPEFGAPVWNGTNQWRVPLSYLSPYATGLAVNPGYDANPQIAAYTPANTVAAGNASALDEWYVNGVLVDNSTNSVASIEPGNQAVLITKVAGNFTGTETIGYLFGLPGTTAALQPLSLVYDNRWAGGGGGIEVGMPAMPIY